MSARILRLAAALITLATAAAAQTPSAKDQPAPGMELGRAVQPVMDREILAHLFFNELEGRFNGSNTEFRWEGEGGSAPITINCGSSRRECCKEAARSTTASLSSSTAARSRPISICKAGCAATSIHGRPAIGGRGHSGSRALLF